MLRVNVISVIHNISKTRTCAEKQWCILSREHTSWLLFTHKQCPCSSHLRFFTLRLCVLSGLHSAGSFCDTWLRTPDFMLAWTLCIYLDVNLKQTSADALACLPQQCSGCSTGNWWLFFVVTRSQQTSYHFCNGNGKAIKP